MGLYKGLRDISPMRQNQVDWKMDNQLRFEQLRNGFVLTLANF